MVDEDRYCADIPVQTSSVHEAVRGVSQALLRNHLRHCVTTTIQAGKPAESEAMITGDNWEDAKSVARQLGSD